jgi:hypothetical protein
MQQRTVLAFATVALATAALAVSPHFISATGVLNADGEYVASFKEAGLGNDQTISYILSAGSGTQFTYQCYTKSNNAPSGSPNNVFPSTLQTGGTFNSGKNGQITASLTLVPQPDEGCQGGGLKLCLVYVNYQNVVLTDTTTPVSVNLPSRTDTYIAPNGNPTNCEPF